MSLLSKWQGTGVAMVTPFNNGKIDYAALETIINHLIHGGVEYIVCLGTTGEAIPLTSRECREVLDFTIRTVNKRVPIVAGFFGGNSTLQLAEKIRTYNYEGVDAIMSSSPSYNKPTQEGIYQHYMVLAEASPLPMIIYNVPGRTSSNVEADTILRLARGNEKFIAVKEASGNLAQAMKIMKDRPEGFLVLSGDDPITLPLLAAGADGVISVIANAYPSEFSGMVRAALHGDYRTARFLNELLLDLHKWLYIDGNPAGVKAAMEILGLCSREVKLPLVSVTDNTFQQLKKEIEKIRQQVASLSLPG